MIDLYVRMNRCYVRINDLYVRNNRCYVRMNDLYVRNNRCYVRINDLYVRNNSCYERMNDLYVRNNGCYVRMNDLYERMKRYFDYWGNWEGWRRRFGGRRREGKGRENVSFQRLNLLLYILFAVMINKVVNS